MAIISAILSLLSRKIGDLLQALFGWSIAGLFGRLPSRKQTALSIALILSILWPVLVVGCFLPKVAAWAVALVPLHDWLGKAPLRALWIVLAAVVPVGVGMIVAWVAPAHKQRGGTLRTLLSGYPLTLGLFLSFLLTFLIVPVLKLSALARRWADEHIYVQPEEGAYRQTLQRLMNACRAAGVEVHEERMPRVMGAPLQVLRWFARSALDPIVAADPRRLRGEGVELYLYPADLLVRGLCVRARRIRAAIVREMMDAPAYLTQDPKAQAIEDALTVAWALLEQPDEIGKPVPSYHLVNHIDAIAASLNEADLPYEDWVLLSLNVSRLKSVVRAAPLDAGLGATAVELEEKMSEQDINKSAPVVELMKEVVDEARALLKSEIALARDEATQQLAALKRVVVALGIAVATALLGLAMLLTAMVMAIAPHWLSALISGGVLLVGSAAAGFFGYRMLPKKPLEQTQERLREDVELIKEPEKLAGHTPVSVWTKPQPELAAGYHSRTSIH